MHELGSLRPGGSYGNDTPRALVPEEAHTRVGEVLGGYVLERVLGEGTMGRVFLAKHLRLGRAVAIKVLRPEHAANNSLCERFCREARAVSRFRHPNLVQLLEFHEDVGPAGLLRAYCVLDYLDGESLAARIAKRPMRVAEAARFMREVCLALAAAHDAGVVHRDVKPENLYVTREGEARVLDFGVARLLDINIDAAQTHAGALVGTPLYVSPEEASGQGSGPGADLYAVAAVLYELLSGRPPFRTEHVPTLVEQIATVPAPPLPPRALTDERIPARLRRLIARCLLKNPSERLPDMRALADALKPFVTPVYERHWMRVRSGMLVGASLAVGLVLGMQIGDAPAPAPVAAPTAVLSSVVAPPAPIERTVKTKPSRVRRATKPADPAPTRARYARAPVATSRR